MDNVLEGYACGRLPDVASFSAAGGGRRAGGCVAGRASGVSPMDSTPGFVWKNAQGALRLGPEGWHTRRCNAMACLGRVLGVIWRWVLWTGHGRGLSSVIVLEAGGLLLAPADAAGCRRGPCGPASGSAPVCPTLPRSGGNTRAPRGSGPSEGHTGGNGSVLSGFLAPSGPLSRCGGVSGSCQRLCVLCGVCSPV